MSDTLSKIEKRTAYILLLPAVFLVFSIILFPIFANVWISFKEVGLKDIRIPEPRAKKIVKSVKESPDKIKIIYKLRNSSLILDIRDVMFQDKIPKNTEPLNLDQRCKLKSLIINSLKIFLKYYIFLLHHLLFEYTLNFYYHSHTCFF